MHPFEFLRVFAHFFCIFAVFPVFFANSAPFCFFLHFLGQFFALCGFVLFLSEFVPFFPALLGIFFHFLPIFSRHGNASPLCGMNGKPGLHDGSAPPTASPTSLHSQTMPCPPNCWNSCLWGTHPHPVGRSGPDCVALGPVPPRRLILRGRGGARTLAAAVVGPSGSPPGHFFRRSGILATCHVPVCLAWRNHCIYQCDGIMHPISSI